MNGKTMSAPPRRRGFTLVEMLIVLSIMAILASIAVPTIRSLMQKARVAKTKSLVNKVELAMAAYKSFWGFYPPGGNTINLNSTSATRKLSDFICTAYAAASTQGRGPAPAFLELKTDEYTLSGGKKILIDAWGNALYVYSATPENLYHNKNTCDVFSRGPNRTLEVNNVDNDANGYIDDETELTDDITNWNKE